MSLERGTLLHKRYRIVEILGQGGMGYVYRAVDENLGVDVAVKENLFTTDEYARQFRLEAVILAGLRHPNLTRVTDHFVIGDQGQYLVMDYIEGEDLRQRMERMGNISEQDAILIGVAMCDALSHLHTRKPPILHRDVKPGNVKITPDGHIFLVDFGLAKILRGTQATTTGARAMTPGYSPPEQYGTARTDARTDIYSLGATLYAALTGVIPEDGLARAMDNVELTPLRKRNAKVSRQMAIVIEKAMAVKVEDRYQTAEDFRQALANVDSKTVQLSGEILVEPPPFMRQTEAEDEFAQDEEPVQVKKTSRPVSKPVRRRLGWAWMVVLALVAGGILLGVPSLRNPVMHSLKDLFLRVAVNLPVTATSQIMVTTTSPQETSAALTPASGTPQPTLKPTLRLPSATATLSLAQPSPTPTQGATLLGGGGSQLAYVTKVDGVPQIHVVDLVEQTPHQVTSMEGGACQPAWSPDGAQLVFISPCAEKQDTYPGARLYTINLDGSGLTPLPVSDSGDFDPDWSPDGGRIAFTSLRDGFAQIYVIDLQSGIAQRLTQTDAARPARQPAWSPDGSKIAYSQKKYEAWEIWVMTDQGEGALRVVLSDADKWDMVPAWSADGLRILFTQSKKLGATTWLMEFDLSQNVTGFASQVLNGEYASHAVYSPDGQWIALENSDGVNIDIYLLNLLNAKRKVVISGAGLDFDPAWRP